MEATKKNPSKTLKRKQAATKAPAWKMERSLRGTLQECTTSAVLQALHIIQFVFIVFQ